MMMYDKSWTWIGIAILLHTVFFVVVFVNRKVYGDEFIMIAVPCIASIAVRVWISNEVAQYVRKFHGNVTLWRWFSFLSPSISTIILGQIRRF